MWENAPKFGALMVFAEHRWAEVQGEQQPVSLLSHKNVCWHLMLLSLFPARQRCPLVILTRPPSLHKRQCCACRISHRLVCCAMPCYAVLCCCRYYGESKPWGSSKLRHHMGYLTVEQALAGGH